MLTVLNRKELCITFSMQERGQILDALTAEGIPYQTKTINRNSPAAFSDTRARTGTLGQHMELAYEYIIYVHKDDLEKAKHLMEKGGR